MAGFLRLWLFVSLIVQNLWAADHHCERVIWGISQAKADPSWTERATLMWFPRFPGGPSIAGHMKLALGENVYTAMGRTAPSKTLDVWRRSARKNPRHFHLRFTLRASSSEVEEALSSILYEGPNGSCSNGACRPLKKAGVIDLSDYWHKPSWAAGRLIFEGLRGNPRMESISLVGRSYLRGFLSVDTLTELTGELALAGIVLSGTVVGLGIASREPIFMNAGGLGYAATFTSVASILGRLWLLEKKSRALEELEFEREKKRLKSVDLEAAKRRLQEAFSQNSISIPTRAEP